MQSGEELYRLYQQAQIKQRRANNRLIFSMAIGGVISLLVPYILLFTIRSWVLDLMIITLAYGVLVTFWVVLRRLYDKADKALETAFYEFMRHSDLEIVARIYRSISNPQIRRRLRSELPQLTEFFLEDEPSEEE